MSSCRLVIAIILSCAHFLAAQDIKSPERYFGFKMGTDRKLIHWEQITEYFTMLDVASDKIQVVELGQTTLGRSMIMGIISAEATIANLGEYQQIQRQLAHPSLYADVEPDALLDKSKAVVILTMSIHANEVAASQGSLELAHFLVTDSSAETQRLLDEVILLIVPSLNPDGEDLISKWYMSTVGTEYESSRMPYKYHHYADHDNNRDWFFFSLQESRHIARVLYHEWYPEIVMDQHQMGSSGARLFLPPYADPVNPNVAPSLTAYTNLAGKHIVADMQAAGFKGLVTGTIYNAYFEGTMSKTPLWHNRIGILTEAASVRYASPMFIPKSSLHGMGIDLPEYRQQTNFVDPWEGGWWRLRDIVEYQKSAALSLLDFAARYKREIKENFYRLNRAAMTTNPPGHPYAYVIPVVQHDPNSALEMLKRLRIANVAVYRATSDTDTPLRIRKGDFVIPLNQPARPYIKDLMEVQHYPNLKEYPGGPPRRPYDVTAWTLPLQFGALALPCNQPVSAAILETVEQPVLSVDNSNLKAGAIALERRHGNSYQLVNQWLKEKRSVWQLERGRHGLERGSFVFQADKADLRILADLSARFQTPLQPVDDTPFDKLPVVPLRAARVGIYQPWIPGVYDEGWLRLVCDDFGFEYSVLHNRDLRRGDALIDRFDVIIFTSQSSSSIVDGRTNQSPDPKPGTPKIKQEYTGGIGSPGVERIKRFIEAGGTVLMFGDACELAIDELDLPVRNVLANAKRDEFFIPGSLMRMQLDQSSDLAGGMPAETPIYVNNRMALALKSYPYEMRETGRYGQNDLLLSGWAIGSDRLKEKVALAEIPLGKGKAILYAFRPQHRSQTYATFKLIFNALYK